MVRGRDRKDDTTVAADEICDVRGCEDKGTVLGVEIREDNCRVGGQEGAGVTVPGEVRKDAGVCITSEDINGVFDIDAACEFDGTTFLLLGICNGTFTGSLFAVTKISL